MQNKIKTIEGLESLRSLKFIALANNCITRIQGLICLTQLAFLDLSENAIKKLDLGNYIIFIRFINNITIILANHAAMNLYKYAEYVTLFQMNCHQRWSYWIWQAILVPRRLITGILKYFCSIVEILHDSPIWHIVEHRTNLLSSQG